MADEMEGWKKLTIDSEGQAMERFDRLMAIADTNKVYSAPVTSGQYTVINACEVMGGLGLGFGFGGGSAPNPPEGTPAHDKTSSGSGVGGGGGGGGSAFGRPVAVITVGPDGVKVEPIVDVSKIALAWATAFGAMFLMFSRMKKASRK